MNALFHLPFATATANTPPTEELIPEDQHTASVPKRILIVDDDSSVRAAISSVLSCERFEVHEAADGPSAIRTAVKHQPDLVLLDLNMPNMDGWAAFLELESVRPLLPVIVITARPNQYKHAIRLGVDAFMEKPLNFPILLRAIRKFTEEPEVQHVTRVAHPDFVTAWLDNELASAPGEPL